MLTWTGAWENAPLLCHHLVFLFQLGDQTGFINVIPYSQRKDRRCWLTVQVTSNPMKLEPTVLKMIKYGFCSSGITTHKL